MRNRFLKPFLILEFLIALQVLFTLWSEVGGQYHLDLMYWPWKLGLSLLAASLIVAITSAVARAGTSLPRIVWVCLFLLLMTLVTAGVVTYYYHVNEPTDDELDAPQNQPARALNRNSYQTRQEFWPRTIG